MIQKHPSDEPAGIWRPVWPGPRAALLRLFLIGVVLLPCEWAVFALLVGDWKLNLAEGTEESWRHIGEATVIFAAVTGMVFLASLLPVLGWLHRFLNWLFTGRVVRRGLIVLTWTVTLVVLFYVEEDWRGSRAWNTYRHALEAGGAQLDMSAFIPKPIPDEQNFAATPFVQSWFLKENRADSEKAWSNDDYSRAANKVSDSPASERGHRHFMDLVAWKMAFDAARSDQPQREFKSDKLDPVSRAQAVPAILQGLMTNEFIFAELRAAGQRPHSRYPVVYDLENPWGILLPHLANIKNVVLRLQLKACAELAGGNSDAALEDVRLMFDMADTVKEEPFLISYLVRLACVHLAAQPVWEGLVEHRWSDAQLQGLQMLLQRYDFVADMKKPFDGERAAGVLTADIVRKKGLGQLVALIGPGSPTSMDFKFANWCGGFIPRGWYYQEQLNYCRLYQMQLEGAIELATRRISPDRINTNAKELEREFSGGRLGKSVSGFLHHCFLSALLLPSLQKIPAKAAMAQTAADQAALACALERYRLANRQFPDNLETLVPRFISQLPADALTGAPYNYRRNADGQFLLYSVGWNEKDDGGAPGPTLFHDTQGDWVWCYPEK